ncbi:hypothetical protein [Streptomyces sp. CNQ431]|uniref:hypothetical protein n=1 Tax=Streptomyces sp. CNQ431 TaxID=1571532 RepID=UPI00053D5914|nr:hypothetical protein [Streptomyces sp. CNQ431]
MPDALAAFAEDHLGRLAEQLGEAGAELARRGEEVDRWAAAGAVIEARARAAGDGEPPAELALYLIRKERNSYRALHEQDSRVRDLRKHCETAGAALNGLGSTSPSPTAALSLPLVSKVSSVAPEPSPASAPATFSGDRAAASSTNTPPSSYALGSPGTGNRVTDQVLTALWREEAATLAPVEEGRLAELTGLHRPYAAAALRALHECGAVARFAKGDVYLSTVGSIPHHADQRSPKVRQRDILYLLWRADPAGRGLCLDKMLHIMGLGGDSLRAPALLAATLTVLVKGTHLSRSEDHVRRPTATGCRGEARCWVLTPERRTALDRTFEKGLRT